MYIFQQNRSIDEVLIYTFARFMFYDVPPLENANVLLICCFARSCLQPFALCKVRGLCVRGGPSFHVNFARAS